MSSRRANMQDTHMAGGEKGGDDDIEMREGSEQMHSDNDMDAAGEGDQHMYNAIQGLITYICSVKEDGEEIAAGFQRLPNRRTLPDYFEVIPEPIAFSTIRGKIQKKQYNNFHEFVKDIAQICHNAQVYNRPSAPIFGDAVRLREAFAKRLEEMAEAGDISRDEASLPDLGDLPPAEDSPPYESEVDEDEDEDEEDEDEDDDDDDDVSDDDTGRRRKPRSRMQQSYRGRANRDDSRGADAHKKHGRPPVVLTPLEARIASILRGLRRFRDGQGALLISPFEKLPDKTAMVDYYQTIKNPIALDNIKRKAKRKKYRKVDELLDDINQMFDNAKIYNEDDSAVYQSAVELQQHAHELAEQEKAKPDDDFRDEDGKLPLDDIQYNGQIWRVGDWVHIRNPNDLAKPIVAQIFRTWQDRAGQKWINACWYYRPEQTVHRFEKHFFEHEVVKTGQYRDHQIGEVLERCFVMFVTRFNKGRPRGFPTDKEVYVCESRYNEEKFRFNKIKTWASCVPDEVRDKDYEMDLFDMPRPMRKAPSPIKHLLREDARETDELPRPTWGSPNAPPIVGAVHRRLPEPNESPPPAPTPPQLSAPDTVSRPTALGSGTEIAMDSPGRVSRPPFGGTGQPTGGNQYNMTPAGHFHPEISVPGVLQTQQTPVPIPQPPHSSMTPQVAIRPVQYQQQQQGYAQNFVSAHAQPGPAIVPQSTANPAGPNYNQQQFHSRSQFTANSLSSPSATNAYNPPRPPEVYTLPDNINEALSEQIRSNFQHDASARVLFFSGPPLDRAHKGLSPQSSGLGHSIRYLNGREEWLAERNRKRKAGEGVQQLSSKKADLSGRSRNTAKDYVDQAAHAVSQWCQRLGETTAEWEREAGLEGWIKPV